MRSLKSLAGIALDHEAMPFSYAIQRINMCADEKLCLHEGH